MKRVLLVIVILVASLWIAKNLLAKVAITSAVKAITGLGVDLQKIDVGIVNTRIGITGLKVMNPSGFSDPVMISVPEAYIDYDLAAFLKGKAHIEEMRLDLAELEVIKNAQGQLNLSALNVVKKSEGQRVPPKEERPAQMPFQIDQLHLRVGKVVYKDYTGGGPPRVREYALNVDEHYQRITDPYAFGAQVIAGALLKVPGLGEVRGIAQSLQQNYSSMVGGVVDEAVRQVEGLGQGVVGSAGGRVDQAVKETGNVLKKFLPSGNP